VFLHIFGKVGEFILIGEVGAEALVDVVDDLRERRLPSYFDGFKAIRFLN